MNKLLRCDSDGVPYMVQNLKEFMFTVECVLFNGNKVLIEKHKLLPPSSDPALSKLLNNDIELLLYCVEDWCTNNFKNYGLGSIQSGIILIPTQTVE